MFGFIKSIFMGKGFYELPYPGRENCLPVPSEEHNIFSAAGCSLVAAAAKVREH